MNIFNLNISHESGEEQDQMVGVIGPKDPTSVQINPLNVENPDPEQSTERLEKIIETIDSLDISQEAVIQAINNGEELSIEAMEAMGNYISFCYQKCGVDEKYPVHVSHEQAQSQTYADNGVWMLEQLDQCKMALSTEATNILGSFWRGVKDTFGSQFDRIDRLKKEIKDTITSIKAKGTWDTNGHVKLKDAGLLMRRGDYNLNNLVKEIAKVNDQYFKDGKFIKSYLDDLASLVDTMNKTQSTDINEIDEIISKNHLFSRLGKPFVDEPNSIKASNVLKRSKNNTWRLTDSVKFSIKTPTSLTNLIPDQDDLPEMKMEKKALSLPKLDQKQSLELLSNLYKALEDLPNENELIRMNQEIFSDIEQLTKATVNIDISKMAKPKEFTTNDWVALGASVTFYFIPFISFSKGSKKLNVSTGMLKNLNLLRYLYYIQRSVVYNEFGKYDPSQMLQMDKRLSNKDPIRRGFNNTPIELLMDKLIIEKYVHTFEVRVGVYYTKVYRNLFYLYMRIGNALVDYVQLSAKS